MLKNYLKIAWRNLLKNRIFTAANIVGLTLAFAVAVLLGMSALFELSYDQFHKNKDSLYQVYLSNQTPNGPQISRPHPIPFAPALRDEVPGIKHIARALSTDVLATYNEKELNLDAEYVDFDYFSLFSYPTVMGNSKSPLQDKSAIALTERAAKKLFGTTDGIGKTVNLQIGKEERPFTVSAILKDIPANSSVDFDIAIPFENHQEYAENIDRWDNYNHRVYLQLEEGYFYQTI